MEEALVVEGTDVAVVAMSAVTAPLLQDAGFICPSLFILRLALSCCAGGMGEEPQNSGSRVGCERNSGMYGVRAGPPCKYGLILA